MSRPRAAALLAAALLTAPFGDAKAAVYKGTDGNGQARYGDVNRDGGPALTQDDLRQRRIAPAPAGEPQRSAADAAQRRLECQQLRDRLDGYRSAVQIYGRDPDGNVYALSPAQTGLLLLETERDRRQLCGNAADAALH